MNVPTTVLVTGVGGRSYGNQILHALLLQERKYRIVVTDADSFSFGLYETPHRYQVPYADDPEYIQVIQRIVEKEKIHAILPGTEAENLTLAQNRKVFESMDCEVISSSVQILELCDDKSKVQNWLEENGLHAPVTVDASDWQDLTAKKGFPIIGKPASETGGSRNVAILADEKEVNRYLEQVSGNNKIIFQEYVGSAEDEYTVGVLVSKRGAIIDSIVMHRKLMGLSLGKERMLNDVAYAISTGYSQGFIVKHYKIQRKCEQLALRLGIRGPLNVQCRFVDEKMYVFELHPRFSGTTSIRADTGLNEPHILIRNFLYGEEFGRQDYQHDVAAIRAFRNIIVSAESVASVPKG